MYSSSRPAAAVTVQLLFWTHFLREHKGTVLTKRNDLHQLAGCALIHTENHVKWEIARESSARRSTATVSVWVSGFGATQKQSLETVCRNKRFISVAWEGPITHIHTCTHTHTHTHTHTLHFFEYNKDSTDINTNRTTHLKSSQSCLHFKVTCHHRRFQHR